MHDAPQMKRLNTQTVGVDSGEVVLFSDFENGGEMWTGRGQRERRKRIHFSESFSQTPSVNVSCSLLDVDQGAALRADITAEAVTTDGFDVVFRTWGDSRIARIRAAWLAIGALRDADDWDVD